MTNNPNCPKCTSDYTLDVTACGDERRRFRCGACGHRWKGVPLIVKLDHDPRDGSLSTDGD